MSDPSRSSRHFPSLLRLSIGFCRVFAGVTIELQWLLVRVD